MNSNQNINNLLERIDDLEFLLQVNGIVLLICTFIIVTGIYISTNGILKVNKSATDYIVEKQRRIAVVLEDNQVRLGRHQDKIRESIKKKVDQNTTLIIDEINN